MASSNPKDVPKVLPPDVTLGVGFQHKNLGGGLDTNIQSTTLTFSVFHRKPWKSFLWPPLQMAQTGGLPTREIYPLSPGGQSEVTV